MKKLDVNLISQKIQKALSPQSLNDLNVFLEKLPIRAGYPPLILACFTWFVGGLGIVYGTTLAQNIAENRTELTRSEALRPVVPKLIRSAVADQDIKAFVDKVNPLYDNVKIENMRDSKIKITADSGIYFGAWREAINHAYNGGHRWRLQLESLCVGRECEGPFLNGVFKISTLKIE